MQGFCGWLSSTSSSLSPSTAVAGIGGDLYGEVAATDKWAFKSAQGPGQIPDTVADDGDFCVISGQPRSQSKKFTALIEQFGLAKACQARYREAGNAFLSELDGPFALAMTQHRGSGLLLAIDKMGIEQIFYVCTRLGVGFTTQFE